MRIKYQKHACLRQIRLGNILGYLFLLKKDALISFNASKLLELPEVKVFFRFRFY